MDSIKKDMTSEEKLLNLIRKKTPEKKEAAPASAALVAPDVERRKISWQRDIFNILQIGSRLLAGACLVIGVYIVMNLGIHGMEKKPVLLENLPEAADPSPGEGSAVPPAKDFSNYSGLLSGKNIFFPDSAQPEPVVNLGGGVPEDVQPVLTDFGQGYKVVGIILDNDPKAVIEDVRNENTFFLSKGEEIGGATVESIEEGRVILLYNQQRVELVP